MKRTRIFQIFLILIIFNLLASLGHSTQISSERVEINLEKTATVKVTLFYKALTSDKLSYVVPYAIQDFEAHDSFGKLNCEIKLLNIGTEFLCNPNSKENYTVILAYTTKEMITQKEDISKVTYTHSIVEPTDTYDVKIILPEGYGVLKTNETQINPISPPTGSIGSTGRKITVEWTEDKVGLGKTLYFTVYYEKLGFFSNFPYSVLVPVTLIVLISITFFIFSYRRGFKRKEGTIASVMSVLTEEEKRILEFIIKRNKKCTQKEIVKGLDLSKAKASRLIHNLEKRNLISKIKRGRTNIIRIEKEVGDLGESGSS